MPKNNDVPMLLEEYRIATMPPEDFNEVMEVNFSGGGITAKNLTRIKHPSGGSTIYEVEGLDGPEAVRNLEGVILHMHPVRAYFEKSYEEDPDARPVCVSVDGKTGRVQENVEAEDRGQGGDCASCPLSQFGSEIRNGQAKTGQACRERRRLFMLTKDRLLPLAYNIPTSSLNPFTDYLTKLLERGLPYYKVLTAISLIEAKNKEGNRYSECTFRASILPKAEIEMIAAYRENILPMLKQVEVSNEDL